MRRFIGELDVGPFLGEQMWVVADTCVDLLCLDGAPVSHPVKASAFDASSKVPGAEPASGRAAQYRDHRIVEGET